MPCLCTFRSLITESDYPVAVRFGSGQFQARPLPNFFKERFSAGQHLRMNQQPVLIDQPQVRQLLHDAGAALDHQILAWLLFQCCDLIANVVFQKS